MAPVVCTSGRPSTAPLRAAAPMRAQARMAEEVNLDKSVLSKYMELPVSGKIQAEYLWIDAVGNVRSKWRQLRQ